MPSFINTRASLSQSANTNPLDVIKVKSGLSALGYYEAPDWGVTHYPDRALFKAIREFQKDQGLKVDGFMNPDGETLAALQDKLRGTKERTATQTAARALQSMGRNGDTILAHITPNEALMLKQKGGSGTVHPVTGLLEFFDDSKKKGKYIWRTRGDGKVRSTHADRNGKVFSWDSPPEGGHPGEAPNCRCTAQQVEKPDCLRERLELEKTVAELSPKAGELSEITRQIHNLELMIEQNRTDIETLEDLKFALELAGNAKAAPHPLVRIAGIASDVAAVAVGVKILEIEGEIKVSTAELKKLKIERSKLEREVQSLKNKEQIARKKSEDCLGP